MRIFLFAQHYPVPYKSYYDTQFVDLLEKGHEITIWAGSGLDRVLNEKVRRFGLASRTRRYPTTLRTLPRFALAMVARAVRHPIWAARTARRIFGMETSAKARLMNLARALVLGPVAPDACIIHELGTAVMFPFLKLVYPETPAAIYYHGGETPVVARLQQDPTAAALRSVDMVFSNTRFSCEHAIARGCPPEMIHTLPVGFAIGEFNPPQRRPYRHEGKLQLLSAGRMSEEKGFIYALEAVKLLVDRGITDICYSLTGEGYLRAQLEQYVQQHELQPYVKFLGTISTEQVLEAMSRADVLLLPSLHLGNWAENQACAVQEAMLMKALVITTAEGGVPESIPAELRRFSVPSRDAQALAKAIAEIDALSTADLEQLGEAGRAFVIQGYNVSVLNDHLLARTFEAHARRRDASTTARPLMAASA